MFITCTYYYRMFWDSNNTVNWGKGKSLWLVNLSSNENDLHCIIMLHNVFYLYYFCSTLQKYFSVHLEILHKRHDCCYNKKNLIANKLHTSTMWNGSLGKRMKFNWFMSTLSVYTTNTFHNRIRCYSSHFVRLFKGIFEYIRCVTYYMI